MSPIILANDGELRGSIFLAIPPVCPMQALPETARAAVPRSVNRLRTYAVGIPGGELEGGGERQDGGDDADAAQTLAQRAIERARFGILQRFVGQPFEDGAVQNRRLRRLMSMRGDLIQDFPDGQCVWGGASANKKAARRPPFPWRGSSLTG